MQALFYPFQDGHSACVNTSLFHCITPFADSAHQTFSALPPLIPLNDLSSSIVRVGRHIVKEDKAAKKVVVYRASAWSEEEKMQCTDDAWSWFEGVSSYSGESGVSKHQNDDVMCDLPCQVEVNERQFSLDDAFVETVIKGSLWKQRTGGSGGGNGKRCGASGGEVLSMDRVRFAMQGLCRLLRQHHDKNMVPSGTSKGFCRSSGVNRLREEEETKCILSLMVKANGGHPVQNVGHGSNSEPLFVGLVCHEQLQHQKEGNQTTGPSVLGIRPLSATDFVRSCDGHGDLIEGGTLSVTGGNTDGDERASSMSVMLLGVDVTENNVSGEMSASPFWRAILQVVDFVYVVGRPLTIASVASLIDKVCHTAAKSVCVESKLRHFLPGCAPRPVVCPLLFYKVTGEMVPAVVENCPGKPQCVQNLQELLCVLMELKEDDPFGGKQSCCRDLLQWTFLLGHVWHVVSDDAKNALSSPIEQRINVAITAALDMFVATSEAVLAAMLAMEPLPPVLVRGGGLKAVPRRFSVDDALQTAYRVALLAYETSVAPCIFGGHLTPRSTSLVDEYCGCRYHASRQELYAACKVAEDALKERLQRFTIHCAKQALMQAKITPFLGVTGDGSGGGDLMVPTIRNSICRTRQFLDTPLISHCGVVDKDCAGSTKESEWCSKGCRMVESPVVSSWSPLAKAITLSDHVLQSLLPALLDLAQQRESACSASEAKESEARAAVQLVEDRCLQLQRRWKETEAQLEHQQSALREVKRQNDILNGQLQEACKCLQKLVMTCVGYEETHDSYARKLSFRLKHGCMANEITSLLPSSEEPLPRGDDDSGVTATSHMMTPQIFSRVCTNISSSKTKIEEADGMSTDIPGATQEKTPLLSSFSGPAQLIQAMTRDAHLQLEACHNVVLCLYEYSHEALRNLSTFTTECSSVSLNDSQQSLLSLSLRAARGSVLTERQERSRNVSMSDARSDRISPAAALTTREENEVFTQRPDTPTKRAVRIGGGHGTAAFAFTAESPLRECSSSTRATHDLVTTSKKKQREEQPQPSEGMNHHHEPFPSPVWGPSGIGTLHSLDRSSHAAAVDAIANLQRERKKAVDAFTQLQKRYVDIEVQLADQQAAFQELQHRHKVEEQEWRAERQALQDRLDATVSETYLAHENILQKQREVESWALSWTSMMTAVQAKAQRFVAESAETRQDDDGDTTKHEALQLTVSEPREALRIGQMQLCFLISSVEAAARLRVVKMAEGILAEQDEVARQLLEQEAVSLREGAAFLQQELDCKIRQMREDLLQQQVSAAAIAAQASDRVERMTVEMNCLRTRDVFFSRHLFHVEAAYATSFEVWGDAMVQRCALIFHYLWALISNLAGENCSLHVELKQSQEEARKWERAAQQRADATQKATVELMQMVKQVEQEREIHTAANVHVKRLCWCLTQFFTLYVESFEVWWDAMRERCEFLVQEWFTLFPIQRGQPHEEAPGLVFVQSRMKVDDPYGLRHELRLKKGRIAELEEALRQKKLTCETLRNTVVHLNALLHAQRDLGMPSPLPPLPVQFPELGVVTETPTRAAAAVSLATSMYASSYGLGGVSTDMMVSGKHSHVLVSSGVATGVGEWRPATVDGSNVEDYDKGNDSAATCLLRCAASPNEPPSSTEPRSLGWYLQSLSAIKSSLEP